MDRPKLPTQSSLGGAVLDLGQYCNHCGKRNWDGDKPKRCGGCGVVVYCDRECQRAAWPAHRLLCRSAIEKDVFLSKGLGYAAPMALGSALREWLRIHAWSLNTIVDSTVYLEGGIDTLLSSRQPAFFLALRPKHATASDGNPAEAFEILAHAIVREGDNPFLGGLWGKMQAHYDGVERTLRAQGFFDEPILGGLLPTMYIIPEIGVGVFQTHAILRFPVLHVKDDPQDDRTRTAFRELREVIIGVVGHGATVFQDNSNSVRAEPDLGLYVRHKKAWKWQHLGPNVWDRFNGHKRPTKNATDLPIRSLFSLFDTRNARGAALRLAPLAVKDGQLVACPDYLETRPTSTV